jgi:hypothetical protein
MRAHFWMRRIARCNKALELRLDRRLPAAEPMKFELSAFHRIAVTAGCHEPRCLENHPLRQEKQNNVTPGIL